VPGFERQDDCQTIVYCLRIMESSMTFCRQDGLAPRRVRTDAQDLVNSLGARSARVDPARAGSRLDYSLQFCAALRNPVVREGVNNAAVHRWGLPGEEEEKGPSRA
jgi:hypothetical protein